MRSSYKVLSMALPLLALVSTPSIAEQVARPPVQLAQAAVIIAPTAPPAPQVETVPPPPSADPAMTWETGHWSWTGTDWAWAHGQYIVRPAPAAVWVGGHWDRQPNGWAWVDGHWQQ
jgi:hypothetical protein